MDSQGAYQALVFGASGISGWAILRECLYYPSPNTFRRVIGLTNRGLAREDYLLPEDAGDKWEVHSGLDLLKSVDEVVEKLKDIKDIEQTTHVYFTSYIHSREYQTLKQANVAILSNAVRAVEQLCPRLQFWTLQTGGKYYGVEFVDKDEVDYNPPLKESMPRIPEPHASNIFYYAQYDLMEKLSEGKSWTFTELRPDAIIGFVPNLNAMNLAQALALFLVMYRSIEGQGAEVPYPGSQAAYKALHTDTSQDQLARFHIYASLHPDKVSKRAFNVADEGAVTWEHVWPKLCEWFELKGVGPDTTGKSTGAEWLKSHGDQWSAWVEENKLKQGVLEGTSFEFMSAILAIDFDRHYDLGAMRAVGFKEEVDTAAGYHIAFKRMRGAKLIP